MPAVDLSGIMVINPIGLLVGRYQSFSGWYFCFSAFPPGSGGFEVKMLFEIGNKVIHSIFGFAEIIGIENKEVAGVSSEYYVVQTRKLLLWIPVNNPLNVSLRLPTGKSEFPGLFDILRSRRSPFSLNRNERKFYINKLLNDGAIRSICSLIRDLSFIRKNNKLNDTETSIYRNAVVKLLDEWKYSMSISQEEANCQLNTLLSESYSLSSS